MKDKKKTITPNEINKYLYCPYQWYYERYYGKAEIRNLYKQRNEKYDYKDTSKSHFKKGLDFHNNYSEKYIDKISKKLILILIMVLILVIMLLYYRGKL